MIIDKSVTRMLVKGDIYINKREKKTHNSDIRKYNLI